MQDFASRLIAWQRAHGRHDLPWQVSDPYAVWVSEIMLQQTQVETVIPYYRRFLARFPDLVTLAAAPPDDLLELWSGLGYYARARHMQAAAKTIVSDHGGSFPRHIEAIESLPGVGRTTAAAIAAFAYGERRAILDGNVRRLFCRLFGVEGWPGERAVEQRLWGLADSLLPATDIEAYTQGLMDFGATLCRRGRPACGRCPFSDDCVARRSGRQAELPAARPRKALPERATTMLLLHHDGEILLEKRPAVGLWGGLWSLPECANAARIATQARRLGYEPIATRRLPALRHAFSHFRLTIDPWRIDVDRPPRVESPGQKWMSVAGAMQAALPAPIRRILEGWAATWR